jgi:hypothetical protein
MADWPPAIDEILVPRVGTRTAARYLGRSQRWVEQAILERRLPAVDTSKPGAKRPVWSIPLHQLRAFLAKCELQAERRLLEAEARELEKKQRIQRIATPTPLA